MSVSRRTGAPLLGVLLLAPMAVAQPTIPFVPITDAMLQDPTGLSVDSD